MRSIYEITKGQTTVTVSQQPEKHEAWGSFILLHSATTSLREFISASSSYSIQSSPKRKGSYITRSLPTPVRSTPSTSSSSSMISHVESDIPPILAQLERKSKFCSQKMYCSTCKKTGADFPRCGKCGETWCSRPCRLVEGKRHVCGSRI